uniref:(northern house mosquito) hypothetical protein n=1 Tax=Culex pipiens TaxID=7175 RepID=A0A8D8L0B9_CULPI
MRRRRRRRRKKRRRRIGQSSVSQHHPPAAVHLMDKTVSLRIRSYMVLIRSCVLLQMTVTVHLNYSMILLVPLLCPIQKQNLPSTIRSIQKRHLASKIFLVRRVCGPKMLFRYRNIISLKLSWRKNRFHTRISEPSTKNWS